MAWKLLHHFLIFPKSDTLIDKLGDLLNLATSCAAFCSGERISSGRANSSGPKKERLSISTRFTISPGEPKVLDAVSDQQYLEMVV
jgi:hypothetical protein